jgi:hypothetical protein
VFWVKETIFSLVASNEDENDVCFFLDGTNCNLMYRKQSFLLIAVMFTGKSAFKDKDQAQTFLLQVKLTFH